jgi:CrcB protein
MQNLIFVALGGAIGSVFRYILTASIPYQIAKVYLFGTLSVNLIGSLLIGLFWGIFEHQIGNNSLRILLIVGILGGFTTFSSFSLEMVNLLKQAEYRNAILYVLATNILGIGLAILGYWISIKFSTTQV